MKKQTYTALVAASMAAMVLVAGCGSQQGAEKAPVEVNAYKVTNADQALNESFNGTIIAQNSIAVHASVSGRVVEKYVKGGETVRAGQPLYRLDSRQYQSNLANAQAAAAQSNAAYQNAQVNLSRYEALAKEDAIARQTLDNQASATAQNKAALEAAQAQIQLAQNNLDDTIVYAPFDGTLEMDDVALGTYITAGQTTLVTMNSTDPVYVQFSMSENEYLEFMKSQQAVGSNGGLELKLADGTIYGTYDANHKLTDSYKGRIVETAKNVDSGTGQLIIKAAFPNPNHMLLPNMYASVILPGEPIKGAMLVPTKALLQVLDKTFVMVVNSEGVVEQRIVQTAGTSGVYTIVRADTTGKGIKAGDEIIVDGLTKARNGATVKATVITKEQVEKGQ